MNQTIAEVEVSAKFTYKKVAIEKLHEFCQVFLRGERKRE
jgi:hypothetical protein